MPPLVSLREHSGGSHTHSREGDVGVEAETGGVLPQAGNTCSFQKLGRGKEGMLPESPQREPALPTP